MKLNTLSTHTLITTFGLLFGCSSGIFGQNCDINASVTPETIFCGQEAVLTAFGSGDGDVIMDEDFNTDGGSFGPGWSTTPGAVMWNNPCSPGGVDNTPHAWMGNTTSVPRDIITTNYDISGATAGVTICFDLLFSTQAGTSPCEGPDEADEGVYLQYSIDNGTTWVTIFYFDPQGGYNTPYTQWDNWCFEIPAVAITNNTQFRWHQSADSGQEFDHWGIDNVEIIQNDVQAEIVWGEATDSYFYEYGVGSPGGDNPNPVSPTTTTTYDVQITTGSGDVCTDQVTVNVIDPVYDVDINVDPTPLCEGDCAELTGSAEQVIDPGGVVTFDQNELNPVGGLGSGSIGAEVNINVQGINTNSTYSGLIQEVCIHNFTYTSPTVDYSDFEFVLKCPGGAEITLIPTGTLQGSSGGLNDVCFIPVGGDTDLGSQTSPYSGTYDPEDPFSDLNGCDPNGEWSIEATASVILSFGVGNFSGWSITFDNPPIYEDIDYTWSPTTDLSAPFSGNDTQSISNEACPTDNTTYNLTVSNGVPGCATHTEPIEVVVSPCTCTTPNLTINDIHGCASNTVDLASSIDASSDPATLKYYSTQTDAQNDNNELPSSSVTSSGSYWVRAEDPTDATCFDVFEIVVDITMITTNNSGPICIGDLFDLEASSTSGTMSSFSWSGPNGFTSTDQNPTGITSPVIDGSYDYTFTATIDGEVCTSEPTTLVVNYCLSSCDTVSIRDAFTTAGCTELVNCTSECSMYFLNPQSLSGSAAQTFAEGLGANLVSLQSQAENDCLLSGLNDLGETGTIWIGFNDEAVEGTFVWYDQSPVTYTNWAPGEPNQNGNEDCVQIYPGGSNSGTWNDLSCDVGNSQSIIEVNLCPVVDAGPDITICEGETATMGSNPTILGSQPYTYHWNHNGPADYPNSVTPDTTTSYILSTQDRYECHGEDTVKVEVISITVDAGNDTTICVGDSLILSGTDGTGTWDKGVIDGVYFTPTSTDVYTYTYTANGCTKTDEVKVTLGQIPTFTITATDPNCGSSDGEIVITPDPGVVISDYSIDDGTTTQPDSTFSNLPEGSYPIYVRDTNGCIVTDIATLVDPPTDDSSFTISDFCAASPSSADNIVTPNGTFSIVSPTEDGATINPSTGEISNGVEGTTYTIAYETPGVCTSTSTEEVTVLPTPNVTFTATPDAGTPPLTVEFENTTPNANSGNFVWDFGEGNPVQDNNIILTHIYENKGDYIVTLIGQNMEGCLDTATVQIFIKLPPMVYEFPNIFTPNGDNENDMFKLINALNIKDIEIIILNRWGNLVFESDKINFNWNGKVKNTGADCDDGTYFYKAKLKGIDGTEKTEHGFVQLTRDK